jgi:hypothetical protein
MNPCERYLRLFDLKKYREIQPVIDSIASRNVDCQQVIPLVREAMKVVESDDFEKYNDPDMKEVCDEEFGELLEVLGKEELLSWIDTNSCNIQTLRRLIFLICCPRFREVLFHGMDSGTTIGYIDILNEVEICPLDSLDWLGVFDSIEEIPVGDEETALYIYSRKQLIKIDKVVSQDIITLSELGGSLSKEFSDKRLAFLGFYNGFKKMIDLATHDPNYTILNEKSFI